MQKSFYLFAAVVGTVVPWIFFAGFFGSEGLNLAEFVSRALVTDVSRGATADLLISILVFWVWAYADSRQRQVRWWWLVFPAVLTVGLSLAMPLYFYLRADAKS